MVLRELHTDGFRCLASLAFAPGGGVNVISGDNAQGKTSLLEAVLYAATSKSHRTNQETDLVLHEIPHSRRRPAPGPGGRRRRNLVARRKAVQS